MIINKTIPETTVQETVKSITFTVGSTIAEVKINDIRLSRLEKVDVLSILDQPEQLALRDSLIKLIAFAIGVDVGDLTASELFSKE